MDGPTTVDALAACHDRSGAAGVPGDDPASIPKRGYLVDWGLATLYWLLSLQGLRHAHWAMYFCWIALAAYLAVYHVLFLVAARSMVARKVPSFLAIAIAWTGMECLRSYMLTGISACMLGHTPGRCSRTDSDRRSVWHLWSLLCLAAVNAALFQIVHAIRQRSPAAGLCSGCSGSRNLARCHSAVRTRSTRSGRSASRSASFASGAA